MSQGANVSIHELIGKTAGTTRNELIQARSEQAVRKISQDSMGEVSRQLRDHFMTQSTETSEIVDRLFAKYGLDIRHSPRETPLQADILQNEGFLQEFKKLRGMVDYVRLIAEHGYQYCLTVKKCGALADILGLDINRKKLAMKVASDLEQSLEELLEKSEQPPMKSLKLGRF